MKTYQLVNPIIEGSFSTAYDGEKPIDAAHKMWDSLSKHVVGHVPNFIFTMKDVSNGKLSHFQLMENGMKNTFEIKEKKYKITGKDVNNFSEQVKSFKKASEHMDEEMKGGMRKRYLGREVNGKYMDDDSSSDDEDYDMYDFTYKVRRTSPITYFHYKPSMYVLPTYPINVVTGPTQTKKIQSTLNPRVVGDITTNICTLPIVTPIFSRKVCAYTSLW